MHHPSLTHRPTPVDYEWARDLDAFNLEKRINWALRQVSLRGIEFEKLLAVYTYPKVEKQFITDLRNRHVVYHRYMSFIDALKATEESVPECLWARQSMFPYAPGKVTRLLSDMNVAGLTLADISRLRGKHTFNVGNNKPIKNRPWHEIVTCVYKTLDEQPLPTAWVKQFFPYQPKENDRAHKLLDLLWQKQEVLGISDADLSIMLGYSPGKDKGRSYMRRLKTSNDTLPLETYVKVVRILAQTEENLIATQKPEINNMFAQFMPFTEQRRYDVWNIIHRLGMGQQDIADAGGFDRCYLPKIFGIGKSPSSIENWRRVILGVQGTYKDMHKRFDEAWHEMRRHYPRAISRDYPYQSAQSFWDAICQGDDLGVIPQGLLYPILRARITLDGALGRALPSENNPGSIVNPCVAMVRDPFPIQDLGGDIHQLRKGNYLIAHSTKGYGLPIIISDNEALPKGCELPTGARLTEYQTRPSRPKIVIEP